MIHIIDTFVHLPNGKNISVSHKGIITLNFSIVFSNVFCVPNFHFKLISISKLTSTTSYVLIFSSNLCYIQYLTCYKTINTTKKHNGLYVLQQVIANATLPFKKHATIFLEWNVLFIFLL